MTTAQAKGTSIPPISNMTDKELASSGDFVFDETEHGDASIIFIRKDEVTIDLWTFEKDSKTQEWVLSGLYRTGILEYLQGLLFAKRYRPDNFSTSLIRGDSIIEPVIDTNMRDCLKAYIESKPYPLSVDYITATYEGRLEIYNRQQHLTVNPKNLEGLHTHARPLLRDTETACYIPYKNGIIAVKAGSVKILPYDFLQDRCVWKSQVINRVFDPSANGEECHFALFLLNITNREPDRLRSFRTAIGYLIHHYGNPAEGQAVICYDEEITDARKPEGGTGKGLFGNAIRQIRPVAVIDGKKFDQNDRFCFQQVNEDTAIVWIDDPVVNHPKAERRFTLERFFSLLTEGWSIERKHEKAFRIPAKEGPKLLISSNVVMPNEGSSNIRRQFIIEFGNHYKRQIKRGNEKPIQAEHGCIFFSDDWDAEEWQRFDQYMIGCVEEYLRDGLQPYTLRSADQNRLRQVAGEEFYEWVTTYQNTGLVPDQEYNRDELFREYKAFAGLPDNQTVTRAFTNNITQYAKGLEIRTRSQYPQYHLYAETSIIVHLAFNISPVGGCICARVHTYP
ncbi:hypothetical protein IC229_18485 [Spirosoma sp. BT702]|uniref:NrS-1 polymerase-like helicase domain-containing protein n=1 Tax=Spirosoma profusum TaxID=2771354 RepID=A0A927ARQ5_9BACT|nr:DUF5906 domain-containing protein [Spirosoma profusum]MBD2702641.1 hypothetical protein [Spirosoma profusum]